MPKTKKVVSPKITLEQLKDDIDNNCEKIKELIPFSEEVDSIIKIRENVFNKFSYEPWCKDFAIRKEIVLKYTDVSYTTSEQDKMFDFCYSEYYRKILQKINVDQYENILNSVSELIDFRKASILNMLENNPADDVINNVNDLIYDVKNGINKIFTFINNLENMDTSELMKIITPILSNIGIDSETLKNSEKN